MATRKRTTKKPVNVSLTKPQARAVQQALGLLLDLSEDAEDRLSWGISGNDRNAAERALKALNESLLRNRPDLQSL